MKRLFILIAVISSFILCELGFAQSNLYVKSTEVLVVNSYSGVSTLGAVPAECERAYIGTSGNSIFWLSGGMNGIGTSGRGIVLDPSVTQPLVIDNRDMIKSMQFGTCSLANTTVYVIYLGRP